MENNFLTCEIELTLFNCYIIIYKVHGILFSRVYCKCVVLGGRERECLIKLSFSKNESLEDALRRFKNTVSKAGTIQEARKREFYEKPSVKRKKKSEAARKRKF